MLATLVASPTMAQESGPAAATFHAGGSAGCHDLGVDAPGDDGGAIFGGVLGVDTIAFDSVRPTTGIVLDF